MQEMLAEAEKKLKPAGETANHLKEMATNMKGENAPEETTTRQGRGVVLA